MRLHRCHSLGSPIGVTVIIFPARPFAANCKIAVCFKLEGHVRALLRWMPVEPKAVARRGRHRGGNRSQAG